MGEHKRNPTAIYFKENPWAPDFRSLLGKRMPHGKGIRRVYKLLMEGRGERIAYSRELEREKEERAEILEDEQELEEYCQEDSHVSCPYCGGNLLPEGHCEHRTGARNGG
jgi:DNA-directed RNA polymerase subunit RPC12/RpoP